MPSLKEHSEHSFEIYGEEAIDIHTWMDSPSVLYGGAHRLFRHDKKIDIPKIFKEKYGERLARDILIDHLTLDKIESKYRETIKRKKYSSVRLNFRVSLEEKAKLLEEAKKQNKTLSQLIRERLK